MSLEAGANLTAEGSQVTAEDGDIGLKAEGAMTLAATADETEIKAKIRKKRSKSDHHGYRLNWQPVTLTAKKGDVTVTADDNMTLQGTQATAGGSIAVDSTKGTVLLNALRDRSFESHSGESESGVWTSQYAKGHDRETIKTVRLSAAETVTVHGAGGVTLQVPAQDSFDTTLAAIEHTPGLEWVAEAVAQGKVDVQALQAIRKEWDESSETLGGPAAAVVAVVVSIATYGAGAAAIGASAAASIGSVGTAMVNGAFSTLATKATTDLINAKGDPVKAFKALASSATARALASSIATAGLLHGASAGLDINLTMPANVEAFSGAALQHAAQETALRTVVGTVVDAGINGQDLGESAKGALLSSVSQSAAQNLAMSIGDAGVDLKIGEGDVRKALLHAASGCATGMLGGDCRAGAVAGFLTELTAPAVDAVSSDPNVRGRVASAIAATAEMLTGGDTNAVNIAAQVANTTRMYNRELHHKEQKVLAKLTKNMSPEERRDTEDAALFLTKGHRGISNSNPRKQEIAARVARGALQGDKIALLKIAAPEMFDYTVKDRMLDEAAAHRGVVGQTVAMTKMGLGGAGVAVSGMAIAAANTPVTAWSSPFVTPVALAGAAAGTTMAVEGLREWNADYTTGDQAVSVLNALRGHQGPSVQDQVLSDIGNQGTGLVVDAALSATGAGVAKLAKPIANTAKSLGSAAVRVVDDLADGMRLGGPTLAPAGGPNLKNVKDLRHASQPADAQGPTSFLREGPKTPTTPNIVAKTPDVTPKVPKSPIFVKEAGDGIKPLRRPYLRQSTKTAIQSAAPKTKDGRFIDPNTLKVIDGKFHYGHKYGHEHRRLKVEAESRGMTQKEFNDHINQNPRFFQIEDPGSNMSRKFEKPGK